MAASYERMRVKKSRSGRRPMRVDTLLRKEKDGSLFHEMKHAAAEPPPPGAKTVLPGGAVRPPHALRKAVPTPHMAGIKKAAGVGELVNQGVVQAHNWPLARGSTPVLQPPLGADQKAPPEDTTQPTAQDDGTMKIQCDLRWYAAAADEFCKIACGAPATAVARALSKMAEVTPEEALRSLEQAESLEKAKPTVGQVARYAGLGAVVAPTVSIGREMLRKGPKAGVARYFKDVAGKGLAAKARHMSGDMAAGAVTSGGIPLLRAALDRRAAAGTIRKFVDENAPLVNQTASNPGIGE